MDFPLGVSVSFATGDVLVTGTVGIWESPNSAGEEFGRNRVMDIIRANHARPSRAIIDEVFAQLRAHCGKTPDHDDLTIVVVRFTGD
jgi:sigma-B regulation protein RsbU (phosphoserine phosphatase)